MNVYIEIKHIGSIVFFLLLIQGCEVQKKIVSGREAYELKQYSKATEMLTNEFEKAQNSDTKSYLAYLAGQSYMALHNSKEALIWYEKSLKLSDQEICRFALSRAYKQEEQYEKAMAILLQLVRKTNNPIYLDEYKGLKYIVETQAFLPDPSYNISSSQANSEYNDYSPYLLNENQLLFASDRPIGNETEPYQWTGNYYSNLYTFDLRDKKVNNFDVVINTEGHEGSACLTKAGNEIYYTKCEDLELRDKHCRIYTSKKLRGKWTDPIAISFFSEDVNVGHPCLMADDSLMIFSVGPHGNYDSYDLYYSRLLPTGWTRAAYLEGNINSAGDEKFPTSINDTLFFSSDVNLGLGGLDIYKCYIKKDGSFSRPERLPAPINSGADDFGLVIFPHKGNDVDVIEHGVFTSSRGVQSNDEILLFKRFKVEKDTSHIEEEKEEENIRVFLAGKVVDSKSNTGMGDVQLEIVKLDLKDPRTDSNGDFISEVEANDSYQIKASYDGYFSKEIVINTIIDQDKKGSQTFNFKIFLEPIELNKEVVIDNIFYDYEKWDIRDDARPSLDSLVQLLKINPQISIELASHTDCRGEVDYNLQLSQKRASSAVDYIISNGVKSNRLTAKGYGESSPANSCICDDCSEEEHQINRRTTFKVINY